MKRLFCVAFLSAAIGMSCGGELEKERPWWEVDPLRPPVKVDPPEWGLECQSRDNPAYTDEAMAELADHPRISHPACVRPGDGYGGKENFCGAARDDRYCNACADDQWEGCIPCVWGGFAHEVDGQCITSWLCIAEERLHEFNDIPWKEFRDETCQRQR